MSWNLALADQEKLVKTYHCTELSFPPCDGYLTVTNKRVVFHGFSSSMGSLFDGLFSGKTTNSRIVNEVKIDSISGLNTFYGAKLDTRKVIIGIILAIIAIAFWSSASGYNSWTGRRQVSGFKVIMGLIAMGLAIWQLIRSFRRAFFAKVYSTQATGAITVGEGVGGIMGSAAVFSMSALPTTQTDQMMIELGAMILDIQALGDMALEKWGENNGSSDQ